MTHLRRLGTLGLALMLIAASTHSVQGEESIRHSFQAVAGRVITEFQGATGGIRKPHFDVRRRDTFPEVNAAMVGMLKFEMKPKDEAGWHPVVCVFGYHEGRWKFVKAFHELPSEKPTWTEAGPWYGEIVERAMKNPQ
ncbi:MAG TPA: hypothetical protein VGV13_15525 [Methylomirabilota bacterium]|jgi:hypothetical protein|nr:hypothetical protein [Methylomirabilota bacterium]